MSGVGLHPVLFEVAGHKILTYDVFMLLAILVGIVIFSRSSERNSHAIGIVFSGLLGGALGAKLAMFIVYFDELTHLGDFSSLLYSGKSIVGGLLGGFLGVVCYKRIFGIKVRMGNKMVVPILVAMAIGRIGCLMNGCCYGKVTHFPLAMRLGDGLYRHPTQLYEMIFDLGLAWYLYRWQKREPSVQPGKLYQLFINAYLVFRFMIEFIRDEKVIAYHLTYFQVICMIGIVMINVMRRKENKYYEG